MCATGLPPLSVAWVPQLPNSPLRYFDCSGGFCLGESGSAVCFCGPNLRHGALEVPEGSVSPIGVALEKIGQCSHSEGILQLEQWRMQGTFGHL